MLSFEVNSAMNRVRKNTVLIVSNIRFERVFEMNRTLKKVSLKKHAASRGNREYL